MSIQLRESTYVNFPKRGAVAPGSLSQPPGSARILFGVPTQPIPPNLYRQPYPKEAVFAQPLGSAEVLLVTPLPVPFFALPDPVLYRQPYPKVAAFAQPNGTWGNFYPPSVTGIATVFVIDLFTGFVTGARVIDGQPAVMIMGVDADPAGGLIMQLGKPDGTVVYKTDNLYTGETLLTAIGMNFLPGQYVVCTFGLGEIDQRGTWTATLTAGIATYNVGYFVVH